MSRYNIYPECHESGIAWLSKLPTHWELARFKNIFKIQKRIAGTLGHDVLSITQKGVKIKDTESGDGQLSMDYSKYQIVRKDDFAMNHMDLLTGYVDISKFDGVTSPDYRVFTINEKKQHPRYFLYLLQLCYIAKIFYPLGQGAAQIGRWRLPTEAFNEFVTPVPTYREQQLITTFLDHETAKIDALIEKQQRLIELLNEKRQAVITHAVTKGLNPNVPMKDSGVEWLGEVPAHWEVSQLRYVVREGTSITYGIVQAGPAVEEGVPYIRTSDMSGDALPLTGYPKTSHEIDASYARSRVSAGDLVISIRASVGKCLPVPPELDGANLTQGTAKIAPSSKALAVFMLPFIGSSPVQLYLDSRAKGATFKEITLETLRKAPFLVPPVDEQNEIGRWVDSADLRFKALIEAAEQAQLLLKERRTALISAAVTGKIDVREWQAAA